MPRPVLFQSMVAALIMNLAAPVSGQPTAEHPRLEGQVEYLLERGTFYSISIERVFSQPTLAISETDCSYTLRHDGRDRWTASLMEGDCPASVPLFIRHVSGAVEIRSAGAHGNMTFRGRIDLRAGQDLINQVCRREGRNIPYDCLWLALPYDESDLEEAIRLRQAQAQVADAESETREVEDPETALKADIRSMLSRINSRMQSLGGDAFSPFAIERCDWSPSEREVYCWLRSARHQALRPGAYAPSIRVTVEDDSFEISSVVVSMAGFDAFALRDHFGRALQLEERLPLNMRSSSHYVVAAASLFPPGSVDLSDLGGGLDVRTIQSMTRELTNVRAVSGAASVLDMMAGRLGGERSVSIWSEAASSLEIRQIITSNGQNVIFQMELVVH